MIIATGPAPLPEFYRGAKALPEAGGRGKKKNKTSNNLGAIKLQSNLHPTRMLLILITFPLAPPVVIFFQMMDKRNI